MGTSSWNGYEQNCLFANAGGGKFLDVARPAGAAVIRDSRGVAVADLNADGRLDLVINNNAAPPTVLINRAPRSSGTGGWLSLRLTGGAGSNRDAIGARVRLWAGGRGQTRVVEAGSGYASQSSHELHFGLASAERVETLEITWPSGRVQTFSGAQLSHRPILDRRSLDRPRLDRRWSIEEGEELRRRDPPSQRMAAVTTDRSMREQ